MYPWKAKILKKGQRVLWDRDGTRLNGTVVKKYYGTIWIKWDGEPAGVQTIWQAEAMEHIFTQLQLDQIEEEKVMVESLKKDKP